jgi:hypothetical protein
VRKASTLKMRLVLNTYAYADIALRTKPGYLNAQKPRTETEEKACSSKRAKKSVR